MHHFFIPPEQIDEKSVRITGGDVNHIRNVLRMQPGEQITVSSGGDGKEYRCEIEIIEEDCVTAKIMGSWMFTGTPQMYTVPSTLILKASQAASGVEA